MPEETDKPPLLPLFDDRLKSVPRLAPACETTISRLLDAVEKNAYSGTIRLKLAQEFSFHGYPDLAAGESYMALLLYDEIDNPDSEFHDSSILAAARDMSGSHGGTGEESLAESLQGDEMREEVTSWVRENVCRTAYTLLAESLFHCGCLRSALQFCVKGMAVFPEGDELSSLRARILPNDNVKASELPDRGFVRRELYPWNRFEPDRYSQPFLELVNESMSRLAPGLEVRATELIDLRAGADRASRTTQLGIFAKHDLPPGARIFSETSLVAAAARADDPFCDACCAPLEPLSPEHEPCPDCDAVFCSAECLDAGAAHHAPVCGADVDAFARDAPIEDAADALYVRLLLRCLAVAAGSHRHPLEAQPLMLICGDFDPPRASTSGPNGGEDPFRGRPRTLPFSFRSNILLPINALEKMDVDVFASPLSQTWVANTLFAKIRATASARQDARGRPAVGAVHPIWSLANHSCDPNVAWQWTDGSMRFIVREKRVRWAGKDQPTAAGIKQDEEVLGHYCDVDLPVQERREWAAGALGGHCRCERCVWESSHVQETLEK